MSEREKEKKKTTISVDSEELDSNLREDEGSVENILACALISFGLAGNREECCRCRHKLARKSKCPLSYNEKRSK